MPPSSADQRILAPHLCLSAVYPTRRVTDVDRNRLFVDLLAADSSQARTRIGIGIDVRYEGLIDSISARRCPSARAYSAASRRSFAWFVIRRLGATSAVRLAVRRSPPAFFSTIVPYHCFSRTMILFRYSMTAVSLFGKCPVPQRSRRSADDDVNSVYKSKYKK